MISKHDIKKQIKLTENEFYSLIEQSVTNILNESTANKRKYINENAASKRKYINRIYKAITPLTQRLYKDDDWSGVNEMLKTIYNIDGITDVSCSVEDGGYREHNGSQWKEYLLDIETELGEIIKGTLNCHAAGIEEDPFLRYDMTLTLW